ncbi:MAG: hypothetical protein GC162_15465 [Planctomycetes bacterium]|nr:hypothetical protein [Planctomycetota bacterium]
MINRNHVSGRWAVAFSHRMLIGMTVLLLSLSASSRAADDAAAPEMKKEEVKDGHKEMAEQGHEPRLSDEPVPLMKTEDVLRPKPIIEIGNAFLGNGNIDPGFKLPGGQVWQPSFYVFGTLRSAVQTFRINGNANSEWANRLDIFGNLQLSGTERVLVGFQPFNTESGQFSGYNIEGAPEGWQDNTSSRLSTLFFEGNIGEMFPDFTDLGARDWGFSVGRQPLSFQDGMLINDSMDAVGFTRNNILLPGGSNLRSTFIFAWNEIDRDDNTDHGSAQMYGLFNQADTPWATLTGDFVYIHDPTEASDGFFWGLSSVSRIGKTNLTLRYLGSQALESESAAMSSGHLLFGQLSWTMPASDDLLYINAFYGIDEFASAARGATTGGPLGNVGIMFAAVGLGRYGAALGNRVDDSAGGAIGYQMFLDADHRQQLILELGGRTRTDMDQSTIAVGGRYQQAFGQNWVIQFDLFGEATNNQQPGMGARFEVLYQF